MRTLHKISSAVILILFTLTSFQTVSANSDRPFTDVSLEDPVYAAAKYLKEKEVFNGYPDGSFGGKKTMLRAELVAVILRMQGIEPSIDEYNSCFLDVAFQWFASYV